MRDEPPSFASLPRSAAAAIRIPHALGALPDGHNHLVGDVRHALHTLVVVGAPMSAHTPGPWTITDGDTKITAVHPLRKHAYEIVTVHYAFEHDQFRANARLIAAAPELVEALQSILHHAHWGRVKDGNELEDIYQLAAAALSEAGLR